MPLICHEGVATPQILEFLEMAGLDRPSSLLRYRTESEAIAQARACAARGSRIAYFFPPPAGADAPGMLLVPIALYGPLNNKARLSELVPGAHVPRRSFVPPVEIAGLRARPPEHPVFLKAAVDGATGGGKDLRYCATASDWESAVDWFSGEQDHLAGLIVEDAIPVASTWCLSFAVLPEACVFLGAAEQVFSSIGIQSGSRIDPSNPPPEEAAAICRTIAVKARDLGYLGICGFDVGADAGGRVIVFDLNFRMNGSTPQVLMHAAAAARTGKRVSQSFASPFAGPLSEALARLRPHVEQGRAIPLRIFDGALAETPDAPSFISGLVLAEDGPRAAELERSISEVLAPASDKSENPPRL